MLEHWNYMYFAVDLAMIVEVLSMIDSPAGLISDAVFSDTAVLAFGVSRTLSTTTTSKQVSIAAFRKTILT